jgi:hypothetical protein
MIKLFIVKSIGNIFNKELYKIFNIKNELKKYKYILKLFQYKNNIKYGILTNKN